MMGSNGRVREDMSGGGLSGGERGCPSDLIYRGEDRREQAVDRHVDLDTKPQIKRG